MKYFYCHQTRQLTVGTEEQFGKIRDCLELHDTPETAIEHQRQYLLRKAEAAKKKIIEGALQLENWQRQADHAELHVTMHVHHPELVTRL